MAQMKTPGVYIVEKNAFPSSVVEVATAVPAFIGHTAKADNKGKTLRDKPWRISSMAEFHEYFGYGPTPLFEIKDVPAAGGIESVFRVGKADYYVEQVAGTDGGQFMLYSCMKTFFQNGGGPCYVVSVGDYETDLDPRKLTAGIQTLVREQEPTMVVVPDAVLLTLDQCIGVQQASLMHCGKMMNRISLLDIHGGYRDRQSPAGDPIDEFRDKLGINHLDYAAAYYPWVNTGIVQDSDLDYENISNRAKLQTLLREELGIQDAPTGGAGSAPAADSDDQDGPPKEDPKAAQRRQAVEDIGLDADGWKGRVGQDKNLSEDDIPTAKALLNKSLVVMSPVFNTILRDIKNHLNLLPPSAAMAGIYTMVDNSRGVWKAPANVSLNGVISPAVNITHDDQADLNVTTQGKSINAIRTFVGEGTLVWGARTLDGNSNDWKYVNVRRTMIMLEESIKLASKAYVFEPNDANTWVTMKSMIRNFLNGIWKRGGLAGASADDAFSVHVGLGETMTPEDILEGILRITVLVAIVRPAEFIEITFQQQMQKS